MAEAPSNASWESEYLAEVKGFAGLAWNDLIPRTSALNTVGVPLPSEG